MAQARLSQMYLAIIIEENELGFHRESLWFGAIPENLGTMITAIMDEWYIDHKDECDESIIKYHEMLEDKDNLTFSMIEGEGFNANGMSLRVDLSNDLNVMFNFVINEICAIFAKEGETAADFPSLAAFKDHFVEKYGLDGDLKTVLEGANEVTISKALVQIDMQYDFVGRHLVLPQ